MLAGIHLGPLFAFGFDIAEISASDPYSLNPDSDPDPAKNLNPDPDPDPDPGKFFHRLKNLLEIEEKKNVVHKTIKKIKPHLNPYPYPYP